MCQWGLEKIEWWGTDCCFGQELSLIAAWPKVSSYPPEILSTLFPAPACPWPSGPHSFWQGFCLGSLHPCVSPNPFQRQLTFCFLSFCGQSTKKMKSSCSSQSGFLPIRLWLPDNWVTDTGSLCSLPPARLPLPACPAFSDEQTPQKRKRLSLEPALCRIVQLSSDSPFLKEAKLFWPFQN